MSMIVAIEPDRRRAAQLTGMARAHLQDELVVASSAAQAVDALNGRVPDVLLTAPLLPSQEETAIADYLRQLGSAAAHVQTLTIPLLASASGERDRPVLSAFRRGRAQRVESEGCDPAVFAEQITDYLREARERKVVVPVPLPAPVNDAVEPTADPEAGEPDIASFTIEDAPPSFTGRSFKELLARFDVRDVDEPGDDAPVVKKSSRGRHAIAAAAPEGVVTMAAAPESITFDAEAEVPTIDIAAVNTALLLPEPPSAAAPSRIEARERGHQSHRQDDWALFDPRQCGFPALIAKLDEIASRDSDR
jgi:hypothetical protein